MPGGTDMDILYVEGSEKTTAERHSSGNGSADEAAVTAAEIDGGANTSENCTELIYIERT
jgi:hypothetical protein